MQSVLFKISNESNKNNRQNIMGVLDNYKDIPEGLYLKLCNFLNEFNFINIEFVLTGSVFALILLNRDNKKTKQKIMEVLFNYKDIPEELRLKLCDHMNKFNFDVLDDFIFVSIESLYKQCGNTHIQEKIINPLTGRMVNANGRIGKKLKKN